LRTVPPSFFWSSPGFCKPEGDDDQKRKRLAYGRARTSHMLSQYERSCSASCASTISPKYRHIDLEKEIQAYVRHKVAEITHNMSANLDILREIDEL
jgi:hypothetical protein